MTADSRSSLFVSAVALCALGCSGGAFDARDLDRICSTALPEGLACETDGIVPYQSGLTSDTYGFRLKDGVLVIHLAAVPEAHSPGPFDIHALAVAKEPDTPLDAEVSWGSCAEGCPANPPLTVTAIAAEHAWSKIASGVRGADPGATIPYDAQLELTGARIEIVDLRFEPTP